MKKIIIGTVVGLLCNGFYTLDIQAANAWWYGTVDQEFTNSANYNVTGFVPNSTNGVNYSLSVTDVSGKTNIAMQSGDYEVSSMWCYVGEAGGAKIGLVEISGANLHLYGSLTIGYNGPGVTSTWSVTAGSIQCDDYFNIGRNLSPSDDMDRSLGQMLISGENTTVAVDSWLYVGHWDSGGTNNGHRAYVEIADGATLTCNLNVNGNLSIRPGSHVNMAGGTLYLKGNRTNAVWNYFSDGSMLLYGKTYSENKNFYKLSVAYDGSNYTAVASSKFQGTLITVH